MSTVFVLHCDRPRRHPFRRAPVADESLALLHVDELLRQIGGDRSTRLRVFNEKLELATAENAAGVVYFLNRALRSLCHIGPVGTGIARHRQRDADGNGGALRMREIEKRRTEGRYRRCA